MLTSAGMVTKTEGTRDSSRRAVCWWDEKRECISDIKVVKQRDGEAMSVLFRRSICRDVASMYLSSTPPG